MTVLLTSYGRTTYSYLLYLVLLLLHCSGHVDTRMRMIIHSLYPWQVHDAFKGTVPDDHAFTSESIFESILRGEFPPLYSPQGVAFVNRPVNRELTDCATKDCSFLDASD